MGGSFLPRTLRPPAAKCVRPPLCALSAKLDAVFFDCDGVLADTERDGHRIAFNKV
jgi:hypothetical protein